MNINIKNKGVILLQTIILIIVLTILCTTFLDISTWPTIRAMKNTDNQKRRYLAEAGIERAQAWMETLEGSAEQYNMDVLGAPSPGNSPFDPFMGENTIAGNPAGTYQVTIYPLNSYESEKGYIIESRGTFNGKTKVIEAEIYVVDYLRKFVYSSRSENESGLGGTKYFTFLDRFKGGVISNGYIHIYGGAGGNPQIFDKSSGKYKVYVERDYCYYNWGADLERIKDGATGAGVDLNLPLVEYSTGNYVNMLNKWSMKMDKIIKYADIVYNTDQVFELKTNSVSNGGGPSWNVPNDGGVIYVTGNVEIKNSNPAVGFQRNLTIAATGDIKITGDVKYHYSAGSPSGMLGLVSEKDIIIDKPPLISGPPAVYDDVEIDAIMICDSFWADKWNINLGTASAVVVFGSVNVYYRGPLGKAPSNYGASSMAAGYSMNFTCDERVIDKPPPCFPIRKYAGIEQWKKE
jgi:hypothetical protein